MNIYERATPRTDAAIERGECGPDHARRLEQELETCRDAHMANCLAADTLRTEIRELRERMDQPEARATSGFHQVLPLPPQPETVTTSTHGPCSKPATPTIITRECERCGGHLLVCPRIYDDPQPHVPQEPEAKFCPHGWDTRLECGKCRTPAAGG